MKQRKRGEREEERGKTCRGSAVLGSCTSVFLSSIVCCVCLQTCTRLIGPNVLIVVLDVKKHQQAKTIKTFKQMCHPAPKHVFFGLFPKTNISIGAVISFVCGPNQRSQDAGFPDVSYYPTAPSWSLNSFLFLNSQS